MAAEPVGGTLGFSELGFRSEWDLGCEDWPSQIGVNNFVSNPQLQIDRMKTSYRMLGRASFAPELGESFSELLSLMDAELNNYSAFPSWILPRVNTHPEKGKSFFVQLHGLEAQKLGSDHVLFTGPFSLDLAGFEIKSRTTIELKEPPLKPPKCPLFSQAKPLRQWIFRMIPRPDILEWFIGEMFLYAKDEQLFLQTRVRVKPSALVFAVLPEKVMKSEVELRVRQVFYNLLSLRREKFWAHSAKSARESP